MFGDTGIVNGTDNQIGTSKKISFITNLSISFDSIGILIIVFNFAFLAYSIG